VYDVNRGAAGGCGGCGDCVCGNENAEGGLEDKACVGVDTVAGDEEPKSPSISSTVLLGVGVGEDAAKGVGLDELPNISAIRSWLVGACPFGSGPAAGGTSSLNRST
jgi:hypothetical protein